MQARAVLDPYAALELAPGAEQADIEAAYERLSALLADNELAAYGMLSANELALQRDELATAYALIGTPESRAAFAAERAQSEASAKYREHVGKAGRHAAPDGAAGGHPQLADAKKPSQLSAAADAGPYGPTATAGEPSQRSGQASAYSGQVSPRVRGPRPLGSLGAYGSALSRELPLEAQFTGPLLRRLRESGGATLDDISAHTKISRRYLKAIEAEDFGLLPAPAYVRGFVKEYAKLLGLEAKRVADSYLEKLPAPARRP